MTTAQEFGVVYFPYEEFDEHGNMVYYESHNGWWIKYEYDHSGSVVYREHCDGEIWRKEQ